MSESSDLRRLTDDAVVAYTERAKLMSQLLIFQPRLKAMEVAVLWGYVICVELEAEQRAAQEHVTDTNAMETVNLFNEVRSEFFKTICQDYITHICRSDLKLGIQYDEISDSFNPVLNAMSAERRNQGARLMFALATNAAQLAACTISILRSRLDRNQEIVAKRYAATLVAANPNLNAFEKKKAIEWIASGSWVMEATAGRGWQPS